MASNIQINGADLDNVFIPKSYIWQPGERKTLWSWGQNSYGQLGLGDTTHRSSQIGRAHV